MTEITSIVAATDFSADGNNAVRRAALLAGAHGARLHIVHVLDPAGCRPLRDWFSPALDRELKTAQARDTLRRFATEIAGRCDVSASAEVRVGDTLQALVQASEAADLVVLGQRGRRGLGALLVGSTADRVVRTCGRPVLVVKKRAEAPYRRVLLPIDFSASSDAALQFAARALRGADVHVFHAFESHLDVLLREADVAESVIREARAREEVGISARMQRKALRSGLDGTQTSFATSRDAAVRATLRHARSLDAELIVAGKRGRSTVAGFLLGSVSGRLLSGCDCDMLIVPPPRGEPVRPAAAPRAWPPAQGSHAGTARLVRDAAALAGALTPRGSAHEPTATRHEMP